MQKLIITHYKKTKSCINFHYLFTFLAFVEVLREFEVIPLKHRVNLITTKYHKLIMFN